VIHAMLAGIGIQIALAQLHIVLGGSPQSSALRNIAELPGQVAHLHGAAALLGLVTIAILLAWPLLPVRALRAVPAALVAVVVATAVSVVAGLGVRRVQVPVDWRSALSLPELPAGDQLGAAAVAVFTLAVVASAESLLSAVATDKLHGGPRANLDRELLAQGVGNTLSGLAGGLPITGVIVRSTANISAGARTRFSAILHGLWIVLFVTQLGFVLNQIPLAALAGLLVVVGVKLVNVDHIREMIKHKQATIYFATLAGVVGINLLAGIGLGIGLSFAMLLRRLTRVRVRAEEREGRWHVVVEGTLTFLGVPKLSGALATVPMGKHVDVDLNVDLLDHAAFEALHAWRVTYEKNGGRVDMDQLHEAWSSTPAEARRPAEAVEAPALVAVPAKAAQLPQPHDALGVPRGHAAPSPSRAAPRTETRRPA
ncbi:MAG TPA: SulP family inorganic anion transporter, partial [Polyangiaceae bacterium]|nr:SulP family inorganic anion transporter [Polyangiaceae bacterium]